MSSEQSARITEITNENFKSLVSRTGTVFIDWWAPWCGPCRAFGPIYERVAGRHPEAVFGKVNTDDQSELAGTFGISSIPTLMVFRDGILLYAQPGMVPEAMLEQLVEKVNQLDMDEVRAEVSSSKDSGDRPQ